jgi:hypothetical protein
MYSFYASPPQDKARTPNADQDWKRMKRQLDEEYERKLK